MFFPQELKTAAVAAGFEFVSWYGAFEHSVPLSEDPKSWRTIGVFRRPLTSIQAR